MYVAHLAAGAPRTMPVQLLARDAAAADPGAAEVWAHMRAELLAGMTLFARNLVSTRSAAGPVPYVRDVLWTYHAPEFYDLLVIQRGWSIKRYGRFLTGRPPRGAALKMSRRAGQGARVSKRNICRGAVVRILPACEGWPLPSRPAARSPPSRCTCAGASSSRTPP